LLLPSRPFTVAGWSPGSSLRGFPTNACDNGWDSLMIFASSPERPDWLETTIKPSASRGIRSKRVPLCRHHRCAYAPISRNAVSNQLTDAFRPRGFAPPRRFTTRFGFWACCIPEPAGVRSVSASRRPLPALTEVSPESGNDGPFPLRSSHPLKKSPWLQPYSRRREPLPPRRCTVIASDDDAQPRGFAPLPGP